MQIKDLGGHSGCKVLLCETEDDNVFVRKVSGNINYNNRLITQAEKQEVFYESHLYSEIKTPAVLFKGYTKQGLFYFDMEYIQGITMAEYIKNIEIGKVRSICEKIVRNIVVNPIEYKETNEEIFLKKIKSLSEQLSSEKNTIVDDAISLLEQHNWSGFIKTTCHGDLTLENIIVKDGQLFIIDFLDSFYDSWILDISTIMQDVQCMWSYRYQDSVEINTALRLMVFRDILMDTIKEKAPAEYLDVYYALLLKLIRIFPYVKDKKTYQFLNEKTKSIMDIIREEELRCVH